jgi:hypothetical protein
MKEKRVYIIILVGMILAVCVSCRYGNRIEIVNSQGAIVNMYQSDSPQTLSKEVPFDIGRGAKLSTIPGL